ncbi:DUF262 domain-containing protein [Sphingomonas sp.]|uniref:DUF262 domain-containing protein n=1 Tax=Sphingomonas sp. TaxID=28214 RepID=UPI0028AFDDC3|nr:DUF262 domain-containing protein [Sphingomonas sp.]
MIEDLLPSDLSNSVINGRIKMSTNLISSFREAQSKLVVQTADLPLGTLADMVRSDGIDLQPGFQRRERWSADKQSALIESFLLNVPVPPVYLSEEDNGTYTAIDGKQRLRAISDFMHNSFALKNLERIEEAEGMKFIDLPDEIKNALRLRPFLRVVTLLKQTDPALKYEVFLRLNRGGEALNAQEIRNVAFRGPLNDEIYQLAKNDFLCEQLKISNVKAAAYRDMTDAEYVLRFLALYRSIDNFSGSLVREMDHFMNVRRVPSQLELIEVRELFNSTIDRVRAIWGNFAFKRPEGNGWRDQALAGMYDAQMIAAASITEPQFFRARAESAKVINMTKDLFKDDEFEKSVRSGTNTPARIRYRVKEVKKILVGV